MRSKFMTIVDLFQVKIQDNVYTLWPTKGSMMKQGRERKYKREEIASSTGAKG